MMKTPDLNATQIKYLRLLARGVSMVEARWSAVGGADCPFCPSPPVPKCPNHCPWSKLCASFVEAPDRPAWVRALLKRRGIPLEEKK